MSETIQETIDALEKRVDANLLLLDRLQNEVNALRLVAEEARELVGEADATGAIPQENIDALRCLLWRASLKQGKVSHQ